MSPYIVPGIKNRETINLKSATHERIIQAVLSHFHFNSFEEMNRRCRKPRYCLPRQICMYLMREHTKMYLEDIAEVFGFDHTTVIYAHRTVRGFMEVGDDTVVKDVNAIVDKIFYTECVKHSLKN